MTTIGNRLRALRKQMGLTQEQFAAICEAEGGKQTVSAWETDRNNPSISTLLKLKEHIDYSIDWLLTGGNGEMNDPRVRGLVEMFRHTDERGRTAIFRVAEAESQYAIEPRSPTEKTDRKAG